MPEAEQLQNEESANIQNEDDIYMAVLEEDNKDTKEAKQETTKKQEAYNSEWGITEVKQNIEKHTPETEPQSITSKEVDNTPTQKEQSSQQRKQSEKIATFTIEQWNEQNIR
jgi:hypothetical protein